MAWSAYEALYKVLMDINESGCRPYGMASALMVIGVSAWYPDNSTVKKCNVLLSLVINNSPMNRFPILNSTYVQISCVKYIHLLCWIWPTFKQKSSLFYQQSLGMIQTHVTIFLKSLYSLGDKIRATVQLITYTLLQNCLSLFTIPQFTVIHNSHPK